MVRNAEGSVVTYPFQISKQESVLSQIIDPHLYPEISAVRHQILSWRFYHHFRTDIESHLRQPQIGVYTPVLNHDGSDLAAALETILEMAMVMPFARRLRRLLAAHLLFLGRRNTCSRSIYRSLNSRVDSNETLPV